MSISASVGLLLFFCSVEGSTGRVIGVFSAWRMSLLLTTVRRNASKSSFFVCTASGYIFVSSHMHCASFYGGLSMPLSTVT
ncbi:hypothetical protein B0H10DRAFT_2001439 [Mycena sp. CBHHK59/15]|nr:hypothetical protein B0H10DRAFT_2001439 [Mycena sp. CBHHK59/15]